MESPLGGGWGTDQSMGDRCWGAGLFLRRNCILGQGSGWTDITTETAPFSVGHTAEWLSLLCAFVNIFSVPCHFLLSRKHPSFSWKAPHLPFIIVMLRICWTSALPWTTPHTPPTQTLTSHKGYSPSLNLSPFSHLRVPQIASNSCHEPFCPL